MDKLNLAAPMRINKTQCRLNARPPAGQPGRRLSAAMKLPQLPAIVADIYTGTSNVLPSEQLRSSAIT